MIDGRTFVSLPQVRGATARDEELSDLYFAYGADMNLQQIRSRCGRPAVVGAARLEDQRMSFYGHTEIWDVPMRPGSDLGEAAGISCAECPSGAA